MQLSLIAAISENGVIGNKNSLPWHLPEELKYFKKMTLGKPVVMGRKTFESMGGRLLPNRKNIILSHSLDFSAPGAYVVHSVDEAIKISGPCEELMVIGGAGIYQAFLPLANRLYLTTVHQECEGDAFFPKIDWTDWTLVAEQQETGFTTRVWDKKYTHAEH